MKWFLPTCRWLYRALIAVLNFANLLEPDDGQPRRLSQTALIIYGAMIFCALTFGTVKLKGDDLTLTEGGVISLISVIAGVLKWGIGGRGRSPRDDPPPYDRGGPDL